MPGDSLLFAAGFLSSQGVFEIGLLIVALSAAAVVGDAVNYYLGLQMEEHVFEKGRLRFVKHEHLLAAKAFYERHGGKAIVLARFAPFVRTFTPFVAGVARMGYRRFAVYNVVGGIGWVLLMSLAGYWLGNIKFVSEHFEQVVLLIVRRQFAADRGEHVSSLARPQSRTETRHPARRVVRHSVPQIRDGVAVFSNP